MSLCDGPNFEFCRFANALQCTENNTLDMYILGEITPDTMAAYIIHNNNHHDGSTYEQLGRLARILSARNELFGIAYNVDHIIRTTERKIEAYNNHIRWEREEKQRKELSNAANKEKESDPAGVPANKAVQVSAAPMPTATDQMCNTHIMITRSKGRNQK